MSDSDGGTAPDGDMGPEPVLPKPEALLALDAVTGQLFDMLRKWFDVKPAVTLDLAEIDSAVTELGDPVLIAAMAMRKLQALNLLSTPGVVTSTDVVVAIIQDLDRALLQAPSMYLSRRAENTDWDQAFAMLDEGLDPTTGSGLADTAPQTADAPDPEIDTFQHLHGDLHEALYAIVEASEGEIRYFE